MQTIVCENAHDAQDKVGLTVVDVDMSPDASTLTDERDTLALDRRPNKRSNYVLLRSEQVRE